jgi:hypothetical protein
MENKAHVSDMDFTAITSPQKAVRGSNCEV